MSLLAKLLDRRPKPRVLVIYDYEYWILGRWAFHIGRLFGALYDIRRISLFDLQKGRRAAIRQVKSADLIHMLLPHPFADVMTQRPRGIVLTTIHHWIDWDFVSDAAVRSDGIVTGSHPWKTEMVAHGVAPEKIDVIHSGIEPRYLEPAKPLLDPSDKVTFGFFAKMDSNEADRKGTAHFRRLVEEIVRRGLQARFRVVISGPGWEAFVTTLSGDIEIIYLDFTEGDDMPALYQSLDIYMMLSDVEGGPVTVPEAMASRAVVFATNVGVVQDVLVDEVNGRLVRNTESGAIVDLLDAFRPGSAEVTAMREAGYATARNMLFDQTLAPLNQIYARYLAQRSPAA